MENIKQQFGEIHEAGAQQKQLSKLMQVNCCAQKQVKLYPYIHNQKSSNSDNS